MAGVPKALHVGEMVEQAAPPSRPCALRGDAPALCSPSRPCALRGDAILPPLCGGRTRAGGSEAEHGSDAEHRNQDKVRKFEYRSTNIEEVLSLGHLDLLSVTVSNFGFRISNFYPILVPPLCGGTHLR